MGVLMVIIGQYQMLTRLKESSQKKQMNSEKLYNEFINEESFKVMLETLLVQGNKVVSDLEATVVKLRSEMEKKKTENDACQAERVSYFLVYFFSYMLSCDSLSADYLLDSSLGGVLYCHPVCKLIYFYTMHSVEKSWEY